MKKTRNPRDLPKVGVRTPRGWDKVKNFPNLLGAVTSYMPDMVKTASPTKFIKGLQKPTKGGK